MEYLVENIKETLSSPMLISYIYSFKLICVACKFICCLFQAFNSKSPTNGTGTMRIGSSKPYRHISLMPLSTVKRVVDIREAEGMCLLLIVWIS